MDFIKINILEVVLDVGSFGKGTILLNLQNVNFMMKRQEFAFIYGKEFKYKVSLEEYERIEKALDFYML